MNTLDQLLLCSREAQYETSVHTFLLKQAVDHLPGQMPADDAAHEMLGKIEAIIFNIRRPLRVKVVKETQRRAVVVPSIDSLLDF